MVRVRVLFLVLLRPYLGSFQYNVCSRRRQQETRMRVSVRVIYFLGVLAGCFWVGRYVPYQSWFQYIYSSHYTWSPGCRLYAYSERKDLGRWKYKTNQYWFWADRPTEDLNPRKWINLIGKRESEELREYTPLEMEGLTAIVLYQVRLPIKQVTE